MKIDIGSAPDSWGVWFGSDPKQTPWPRFLDEVAEAGYEWIELGPVGYLPTDPKQLMPELDRRGLKVTAAFSMMPLEDESIRPALKQELLTAGELLQTLGARHYVLIDDTYTDVFTGALKHPRDLDDDAWKRLIETAHQAAEVVRQFNLTLVYHPHADTHVESEPQIERFLADTDPNAVSLCLDTGHHAYRLGDPVAFMRRHADRIRYLHLKNIDPVKREQVERDRIPFGQAVAEEMFCEPAHGAVDFAAFRDVLSEVDYNGVAIVEQDMYPAPFDKPLPIAKRTRQYLRSIGM